jgi:hypothetical protein
VPNINVVRRGILIQCATKLGSGGISIGRNLSQSSTLPTTTTRIIGTPQMVFTNPIMTTHVNMTVDQPLMSSMVVGGYISVDGMNPRGGYQEPFVVTTQIFVHKDGHHIRPNRVASKHLNLKKYVNPNAHVKVFNSAVKANAKTFQIYIINAFSYMLRNTT